MPAKRAVLFPPWLTRAKVHPVKPRIDLLNRHGLKAKLATDNGATVTVIQAPAGFGKSTAMVGWRGALIERGRKVAWVSLDRDDNDPYQLVLYVAFAISISGVDGVASSWDQQSPADGRSTRRLLNLLHGAVENHREKVVLMMDDFDNLNQEVVDAVIDPLIRYAPANLHLVIACRDDGALKTTDLELSGLVRRLDASDLRFTMHELDEFLSPAIGSATVRRLHELTEGWPVAVQLLRTALRSKRQVSDILANLTGDNSRMAAYLSEQVFDNLAAEVQSFLTEISIVDRIDHDLADYLRERNDSAQHFSRLRKLDALVSPVDTVHHAYRLHPIFREYLCGRLTLVAPHRACELHLRAARWYADGGHLVRAVGHCVDGNDQAKAATVIEESGGLMTWIKEGLTRLRAALEMLDQDVIRDRPRLALIQCLVLLKTGKPYDARALFDATLSHLAPAPRPASEIEHEITVIDHLLHAYSGTDLTDGLFDSLGDAVGRIPSEEHFVKAHHFTVLCGLNSARGQFEVARRYGREAIREFRAGHSIYGEVYIQIHLGDVAYGEGNSSAAAGHYRKALELIRRSFSDDDAMKLIVDVLFAELRYGNNRLGSIPRTAETFPRRLERREAWFNILAAAYVTASNVISIRSGTNAALAMLDDQQNYAVSQRMTSLQNLITSLRATLMLRAGRVDDARAVVDDSGLTTKRYVGANGSNMPWRERDAVVAAIARLLIAEHRPHDALAELTRFLLASRANNHRRSCATYHVLRSIAYDQVGDDCAAAGELHSALDLTADSGEVRVFLDEGQDVGRLLGMFANAPREPEVDSGMRDRARSIHDAFKCRDKRSLKLTEREIEVLRELVDGKPNKVIARNMGISHNTVRFHLKNIFAKMNVDNRLRAVDAAHRTNIL